MNMENRSREVEYKSLREKLEAEIAPVPWKDLQQVFARGIALFVEPSLNLVDVAEAVAEDNKSLVESWMTTRKISVITDQQAKEWYEGDASLLTVIVKPWVLVQSMNA